MAHFFAAFAGAPTSTFLRHSVKSHGDILKQLYQTNAAKLLAARTTHPT